MSVLSKFKTAAKYASPVVAAADFGKDIIDPKTDVVPGIGRDQDPSRQQGFDLTGGFQQLSNDLFNTGSRTTNTNQLNDSGGVIGGGGSGGTSQSTWTPAQQSLYDASVGRIQGNLGRVGGQLNTALANVGDQYNQRFQGLQSSRNQAQQDFRDSTTTNQQNYQTDQNNINSQAAEGLRGLLRQLGAMGAGGGSAYLYSAPEAVGDFAQAQLSGAGQGYAQNARQLDRTHSTFMDQAANQEDELRDWRTQQQRQARSQAEEQKITLNSLLAKLAGERALAMNQNVQPALQPYTSAIDTAQNRIDSLARFRPTFSGETPTYSAPELAQFTPDSRPQIDVRGADNAGGRATPYIDMLMGRQREEQPVI